MKPMWIQNSSINSLQSMHRGLGLLCLLSFVLPSATIADEPLRETIDRHIESTWKQKLIQPAGRSSDHEFLRRIYLDLIGTIPSYEEAQAFLTDASPNKREQLIDRLIANPRFGQHQAEVWDQVYFGRNPPGYGTDRREGFRNWLTEQWNQNVPYDDWAKAILMAEGNTVDDGAPMFLVAYRNQPEDATEAVTQKFLGIQLQCARCHDHPFEPWTQLDFYGTAAFFSRLQVVEVGKKDNLAMYAIGEKNTGDILFTGPVKEQEVGKKGEPVGPKFLLGDALVEPELPEDFKEDRNFPKGKMPEKPKFSRKDQLAQWITSPENPYFARAITNRVWAQFMGRGLVHPVDNMSPANEPSHPELLDELTAEMLNHTFDLKWYIRELVNSDTYQLSSNALVVDASPQWYERARSRPLTAEELLDSWKVALGYEEMEKQANNKPSSDRYAPLGSGYLLQFFGRPNNGVGDYHGGLQEHLYLNNGGISKLLSASKGGLFDYLKNSTDPWEERVNQLYLSLLSRQPTNEELQHFVSYLSSEEDAHNRLGEAIWVLMTCSEFRFNH